MEYIFLIGPSAVGKTTLAKRLFAHYGGAYIEQNMAPEFTIPADCPDVGVFEETLCWDSAIVQAKLFHARGVQPVIALDFDDVRARELPLLFQGTRFIILRLISSDPQQIRRQMEHRRQNEGGLYAPEGIERANDVIRSRKLLPNEVMMDVAGKSADEVFQEAVRLIEGHQPMMQYDAVPDDEHNYLSWVQSRNLH